MNMKIKAIIPDTIQQMSESLLTGALLALNGGFLEVYTYMTRDQVFANAQTGNMVLAAMALVEKNWSSVFSHLIPVFTFALGVVIVQWIEAKLKRQDRLHWRQIILIYEMLLLFLCSVIPVGPFNNFVNFMISFVCALQYDCFKKVNHTPLATTFCTGNLRMMTESCFRYFRTGERTSLRKMQTAFTVIVFFLSGAVLSGFLTPVFQEKAVLFCVLFLFLAFLGMFVNRTNEK